jgi:GntR family transcriptional regulator
MIESGALEEGRRVPPENELSGKYGIGRPTVRQALDLLVRKGLIIKKKGSGTFDEKKRLSINLFSLAGTSAAFLKEGITVEREMLHNIELTPVSENGNPLKGKDAYFMSRLALFEGEPVLLEDIYLDAVFFRGIEKYDLKNQPLSGIIESCFYMKPSGGRQSFGIAACGSERAPHLRIKKEVPVLVVKRVLYFSQRSDVFYSEIYCRTDRFEFYQELGNL